MTGEPGSGAPPAVERRGVLVWLVRGFLSLWALGVAGVAAAFLKPPDDRDRPGEGVIRCGTLSSLPVGDARFVRHGESPIFVVRPTETELIALPAVCTHMRCILKWNRPGKSFLCPCHAGAFDQSGNVISGPPPRALAHLRADVHADEIVVRV
jgi:cytochrome b6-f complex iron-sulfur subunit